jgi:hypothetical protein
MSLHDYTENKRRLTLEEYKAILETTPDSDQGHCFSVDILPIEIIKDKEK